MRTPSRLRRTCLGLATSLVAACAPAPPSPPHPLPSGDPMQIGNPAPDFAVPDETGTVRKLADFQGKTLVLWFYPKADTPG